MRVTEIRVYKLKSAMAEEFYKVFTEQSLPMLKRWNVDVIDFGFSLEDKNDFYLMRNYKSLKDRQESQDAFYGSDEWIKGPREGILKCIENFNTTVIEHAKLIQVITANH